MSKVYLYESNVTDFSTRGLGVLKDIVDTIVTEEMNGLYDISFFYPLDGAIFEEIQEGRIVFAKNKKNYQAFRIDSIVKDDSLQGVVVHAYHISYDLSYNFVEDTFIRKKPGSAAITQLFANALVPHNFTVSSDIQTVFSSRPVRKNLLDALMGDPYNSLLSRAGGQFYRDNFKIHWTYNIGEDRGVSIKYRKNLTGLNFTVETAEIVTRLMPQGFNELLLPEKYIDSPLIGNYPIIKVRHKKYEDIKSKLLSPDEEDALDHEVALARLREAAKKDFDEGLDKPTIICDVNFVDLAQTREYAKYKQLQEVYLGDTVRIYHPKFKVDMKKQVVSYQYDPIDDRYLEVTLGSMNDSFYKSLNKSLSKSNQALEEIQSFKGSIQESISEQATKAATNLINNGFGGYVRRYPDKTLIMDTDSETTAKYVWQYNKSGIGFSETGVNGPYISAWTIDGKFNTDFISAETIKVNHLHADVGQNLDLSSNNSITATVEKTRQIEEDLGDKTSDLDGRIESLRSTLEQTESDLTASFESQINDVDGSLKALLTYFRWDSSGAIIGKEGSPITLQQTNERIAFMEGDKEIASWERGTMSVDNLIALIQIQIGQHVVETYNSSNSAIGISTLVRQV